jgi:hypothetical protein
LTKNIYSPANISQKQVFAKWIPSRFDTVLTTKATPSITAVDWSQAAYIVDGQKLARLQSVTLGLVYSCNHEVG